MAKRNKIEAGVRAEIEERARAMAELRVAKLQEIRQHISDGITTGGRRPLTAALAKLDQLMHEGPSSKSEDKGDDEQTTETDDKTA